MEQAGCGNAANVQRKMQQFAKAGFAGIMLEDQVAPKRCGHTGVKAVVDRDSAIARIQAAVDARNQGNDLVIVARTDARSTLATSHGDQAALEEALWRLKAFADLGADVLFLEAPRSEREMLRFCEEVPGTRMANMLEGGITPLLSTERLGAMGFALAAYPLTLLSTAAFAMRQALLDLQAGHTPEQMPNFEEMKIVVDLTATWKKRIQPESAPVAATSLTTTWRIDRLELIERYREELQVGHNDHRAVSTTTQLTRRFAASKGDG